MNKPPLLIVSGPSGVGKSTVIRRLIATSERPLRLAISATTRDARGTERDGVEYHFWDRQRFEAAIRAGLFLEYAEVHGRLYGTPISEVDPYLETGTGVILDIDVQGAEAVRRARPNDLSVFLEAPTMEDYERRIRARGDADEDAIRRRLARARDELARAHEYDVRLINDNLEATVARLARLLEERISGG